ncbi:hypothetical protein C0J52_13681 [Blattella germanica]|nr:hypothetical protein C0J52_13681 [Blattella germanica]
MNDRVYKTYPRSLEDLYVAIEREIRHISHEVLQKMFKNFCRRLDICLIAEGGHFLHFLRLGK